MNRFKVLYVLNITVLLALMTSVSASARNDNVLIKKGIKSLKSAKKMDLDNPPKLTGRIVKIAGLKFIELLQNKTKNRLYMCMDYEYPFFFKKTDHGYRKNGAKGTICFDSPVKDNEGLLHLMEHLLSNYTEKRGWFSLGSSNIVNRNGMNAYTYFLDEKNNVAEMELDLSEEFLYDENLIKKLSGALLGEADFIKNPEDYMPGYHMYTIDDFISFVCDVCEGKDDFIEFRKCVRDRVHTYQDDQNCERFLRYFGI